MSESLDLFYEYFLLGFKNDLRFDIIIGNPPYLDTKYLDKLHQSINKSEIRYYIRNNINNSLSFTPNDLNFTPVRIR